MGQLTALRLFNSVLNGTTNSATLTTQLSTRAAEWAGLFEDSNNISRLFNSATALATMRACPASVQALSGSVSFATRLYDGSREANYARSFFTSVAMAPALRAMTDLVANTLGLSANAVVIAGQNYSAPTFAMPDHNFMEDTANGILYSYGSGVVSRSYDSGVTWKTSNDTYLGGLTDLLGAGSGVLQANSYSGYSASICSDGTYMYGLVPATSSLSGRALIKIVDHGNWQLHCQLPLYNGVTVVNWSTVCYGGGKFLIVGQAGSNVYTASSTDGLTWTYALVPTVTSNTVFRAKYVNGRFFILMSAGVLSHCTDATTWVNVNYNGSDTLANCRAYGITYATDTYCLMGDTTTTSYKAWYSTNLTSFTSVTPTSAGDPVSAIAKVLDMEAIGSYVAALCIYYDGGGYRVCIQRSTNKGVTWTPSFNQYGGSSVEGALAVSGSNFVFGFTTGTAGAYSCVATQASATGTVTYYPYVGRGNPYACSKIGNNIYFFDYGQLYIGWYFDGTDVYSTNPNNAVQWSNTSANHTRTVGLAHTTLVSIAVGTGGAGTYTSAFRHDSTSQGIYWKAVGACTGGYMAAGDSYIHKLCCLRSGVAGDRDLFVARVYNTAATNDYLYWSTDGLTWTMLMQIATAAQATYLILKTDPQRTLADGSVLKARIIYAFFNTVGYAGIISYTQSGTPAQTPFTMPVWGSPSHMYSMTPCDDGSIVCGGYNGSATTDYLVMYKARSTTPTKILPGWTTSPKILSAYKLGDVLFINYNDTRYKHNMTDGSTTATLVPASISAMPAVSLYESTVGAYAFKRLANGSVIFASNAPLALYRIL